MAAKTAAKNNLKTLLLDENSKSDVMSKLSLEGIEVVYFNSDATELESHKFVKKDLVIEVVDDPVSPVFRSIYESFKNVSGKETVRVDYGGNILIIRSKFLNSPKVLHYKSLFHKVIDRLKLGVHEPTYFMNELKRMSKGLFKSKN